MSLPLWRTIYTLVFSFRHPEPNPGPVSSARAWLNSSAWGSKALTPVERLTSFV